MWHVRGTECSTARVVSDNQANDYSFDNTGAVYMDERHVTGYVSGKLIWGMAP